MSARVGETLSPPLSVNGWSPQGSILGNLLFTVTTTEMDYADHDLNAAHADHAEPLEADESYPIDLPLARIVSDRGSELGIDNMTILMPDNDNVRPFHQNGINLDNLSDDEPECSYYRHRDYTQSTLTVADQFCEFVPPGNLIGACLNGNYSSTTGLTFVHMCRQQGYPSFL